MKSESELEKYGVKVIDKSKPEFQCLRCKYTWTPDKRSNGKMPCEYWYCPNNCTDWSWESSRKKWILKDSSPFVFEVPIEIISSGICKKYMIKKIRKEIAEGRYNETVKKLKELNKEFLFSWPAYDGSDITGTDKIRIKELLKKDVDVTWIINANVEKNKKSITFSNGNNKLSFTHGKGSNVFLKIKNKDDRYKKILKLAMEIESSLFSWEEIPGNDSLRLINFLKQNYCIDWVETANIEKIDDGKTIRVTAEKKLLSLSLNNEKTEVKLQIDDGRIEKFIVKTENSKLNIYDNSKQNIYKLAKFDLALHLEIDTYRLNYQDVDNIQKTVLDALKRDDMDSSWNNWLYEDDAQIFRVLCWKTKKEDDDKYNMAALTISFRVYDPEKQMCMVKLDNSFGYVSKIC